MGTPLPSGIIHPAGDYDSSLALSSTAIVVEMLSRQGRLNTSAGRASFATLLAQDLAVAPLLLFISIYGAGESGSVVGTLLLAVGMGDVANMHDQIGFQHLLESGAEGLDKVRRQIGHEADRVGDHAGLAVGQPDRPHGRIERGEQQVLGHHGRAAQAVEQRRLAGVGVADQRHRRQARLAPPGAIDGARAAHAFEVALDAHDALADQPAVDLDLRFAGAAQEAEAAALPFQVGP